MLVKLTTYKTIVFPGCQYQKKYFSLIPYRLVYIVINRLTSTWIQFTPFGGRYPTCPTQFPSLLIFCISNLEETMSKTPSATCIYFQIPHNRAIVPNGTSVLKCISMQNTSIIYLTTKKYLIYFFPLTQWKIQQRNMQQQWTSWRRT